MERRDCEGLEVRADGRTLTGPLITYGEVSPSHRERFEAGGLDVSPDLAPTLGHRSGRVLAYGEDVTVEDRAEALVLSAHLPRTTVADQALKGVRSGRFRGWSMEFHARREDRDATGVRVVQEALVSGAALVDFPSYESNAVETRQGAPLRGTVRAGEVIDCRCGGPQGCDQILVEPGGYYPAPDVAATTGNFGQGVIASTGAGTMELEATRRALSMSIPSEVLASTAAGRNLRDLVAGGAARIFARPLFDPARSVIAEEGRLARASRLYIHALLLKWTARQTGLRPIGFAEDRAADPPPPRRRIFV